VDASFFESGAEPGAIVYIVEECAKCGFSG
jgi:hypothetical protein